MDVLTDEERGMWGDVDTDAARAIDNELRFIEIRQRRVLAFVRDRMAGAVAPGYEDVLTRLSAAKLRALESKIRLDAARDDDGGTLDAFLSALRGADSYQHPPEREHDDLDA